MDSDSFFVNLHCLRRSHCSDSSRDWPPAHDAEWIGPEMMLLNSLGARTVGQRNIALFSRTYWMSRAYRSHPVGHQLEGFKIAQTVGASSRGFLGAMVIAVIVGTAAGF